MHTPLHMDGTDFMNDIARNVYIQRSDELQSVYWETMGRMNCMSDDSQSLYRAISKAFEGDASHPLVEEFKYHSHRADIAKVFSVMFQEGCLLRDSALPGPSGPYDDLPDEVIVDNACSLLSANVGIMTYITKRIKDEIGKTQQLPDNWALRLTQSRFLNPCTLAEMTNGKISPENATLILVCLYLRHNNKMITVCDAETLHFHRSFQDEMLQGNKYKLLIAKPPSVSNSAAPIDFKEDANQCFLLAQGTFYLHKEMMKVLEESTENLSVEAKTALRRAAMETKYDHHDILSFLLERKILSVPHAYSTSESSVIARFFDVAIERLNSGLDKCNGLEEKLLTIPKLEEALMKAEAKKKYAMASEDSRYSELMILFDENKEEILRFLCFSTVKYKIGSSLQKVIAWRFPALDVSIVENFDVTMQCTITRRVQCPECLIPVSNGADYIRPDLVYFPLVTGDDSVVTRWETIRSTYNKKDSEMAAALLQIYRAGNLGNCRHLWADDAVEFLCFVVVLVLGKEPSYDLASLVGNYVLLRSVELNVLSFEDALNAMPMIPKGAISGKHYLMHICDLPLDTVSRVQYKNKDVRPSAYLPYASEFVGNARNSALRYHDVVNVALMCSIRLFLNSDLEVDNNKLLNDLISEMNKLYNTDNIDILSLPARLNPFCEQRFLVHCVEVANNARLLRGKNQLSEVFLQMMGETRDESVLACVQCIQFILNRMDVENPLLQKWLEEMDAEDNKMWVQSMCSSFMEDTSIQEAAQTWGALCSEKQVQYDFTSGSVEVLDSLWKNHLTKCGVSTATCTTDLQLCYRPPLQWFEIPERLNAWLSSYIPDDPRGNIALKFLLQDHPLIGIN